VIDRGVLTLSSFRVTRRSFLKRTAIAVASTVGFPVIVPPSALGLNGTVAPSNRIALGFIGLGAHARAVNLPTFSMQPDAQVVALCDVDAERLRDTHLTLQLLAPEDESASAFTGCFTTGDWREVVARADVDAVVVSTPDHWHVIPSIAAARAGKDVFCEKPLSLTIHEGRVLANTIRRCGRCFITGSELRSQGVFVRACELVRNGHIGRLESIYVELPRGFGAFSSPEAEAENHEGFEEKVPPWFDYDMWLGQAPMAPYTTRRCHGQYRFIFDYSGGNLTDHGAHFFDIAQWANNSEHTGPISVEGTATFPPKGLFNTATDWNLTYEYANGVRMTCASGLAIIRFEGSDGWVEAGPQSIQASSDCILATRISANDFHARTCPGGEHRDFLDCVKNGRATYAPAEIGHRTATIAHLGNIALRLGRKLRWDPGREDFIGDASATAMLSRAIRSPWRLDA